MQSDLENVNPLLRANDAQRQYKIQSLRILCAQRDDEGADMHPCTQISLCFKRT